MTGLLLGVPLFQKISEVSIGSGTGGGLGVVVVSQLHSRAHCAAMDLADACQ